jgi:hypothetical protein
MFGAIVSKNTFRHFRLNRSIAIVNRILRLELLIMLKRGLVILILLLRIILTIICIITSILTCHILLILHPSVSIIHHLIIITYRASIHVSITIRVHLINHLSWIIKELHMVILIRVIAILCILLNWITR